MKGKYQLSIQEAREAVAKGKTVESEHQGRWRWPLGRPIEYQSHQREEFTVGLSPWVGPSSDTAKYRIIEEGKALNFNEAMAAWVDCKTLIVDTPQGITRVTRKPAMVSDLGDVAYLEMAHRIGWNIHTEEQT